MDSTLNLLIIDDDPNILEMCKNYLINDYENIFCESEVKNALLLFDKHKIDIAIVDIAMPEINGLDFVEIASQKNPLCQFIIITGFATIANLHRAIRVGVFDFIEKPFSQITFLEKIGEAAHDVNLSKMPTNDEMDIQHPINADTLLHDLREGFIHTWNSTVPENVKLDSLYNELLHLFDEKINNTKADKRHTLTPTEKKVAKMLDKGLSPNEISKQMSRSVLTVYVHIKRIKHKRGTIK